MAVTNAELTARLAQYGTIIWAGTEYTNSSGLPSDEEILAWDNRFAVPLTDDSVTSDAIATGAVEASEIAAGAVGVSEMDASVLVRGAGPQALTDAATIAVNAALGNQFYVTLGGNRTLGNPTGALNGQFLFFEIKQDGTGSRTLTLDSKFAFGTDITSVTLTTTANKTDLLLVRYNSAADKFWVVDFEKGF